jgi:hypothetical protein
MSKLRSRMMPRDAAGRIDLIGGTGPIMHMIGLPSFLEIYKADCTFQTQSPDAIDPDRTRPDVPWAWRISDDAGYANPIVARVFIQCAEALKDKTLKRGNCEKILLALHTCKEDLRNSEKALLRLIGEHDKIVKKIKENGGIRVEKGVINDLPQIPNLDHDTTLFLTSSKRALQSVAECLNEFYGLSIRNARFDKGTAQLKKLNPIPNELLECLGQFETVIERVLNLRNFQDHVPKKTVIQNFRITANALLPPMWQIVPEAEKQMLPEMHEILSSIIELVELLFFHGLMDSLAGPFANLFSVKELRPEDRKEGSAIRFRCELTFTQRSDDSKSGESTPA